VICDLTNSSTGKILAALAFSGELGVRTKGVKYAVVTTPKTSERKVR